VRTFLFFMYEPSGSYGAQARPWSWGHDRPQVMLCALQAFWIYLQEQRQAATCVGKEMRLLARRLVWCL